MAEYIPLRFTDSRNGTIREFSEGDTLPEFLSVGDGALRQELADPEQGAAKIARGVVAVDSIADLLALPAGQRREDLRYLVKGYHAGSDVGGGEFYYDSNMTGENDGGITLQGFVRIIKNSEITPEMFGAVGDGSSDDTVPFERAINSGVSRVVCSGNYGVVRPVRLWTSGVNISGYGTRFTQTTLRESGIIIGRGLAGYVETNDISITGFHFVGADDGGVGIKSGAGISIEHNLDVFTLKPYDSCSRINIHNNVFSGWAASTMATGTTKLNWNNNTSTDTFFYPDATNGGYGLLLQTCFDTYVTGNKFTTNEQHTGTDRHAIYVSAITSRPRDGEHVCRGVYIAGNDIDWSNAIPVLGFEYSMVVRSAQNCRIIGNTIRGSFGGIAYNSENGPSDGVVISDNLLLDIRGSLQNQNAAVNFLGDIHYVDDVQVTNNTISMDSPNATSVGINLFRLRRVSVGGNILKMTGNTLSGMLLDGCQDVNLLPNKMVLPSSGNGIRLSGDETTNVDVYRQSLNHNTSFFAPTSPINCRFHYRQEIRVVADSSGGLSVLGTPYNLGMVLSAEEHTSGVLIQFAEYLNTSDLQIDYTSRTSNIGSLYLNHVGGNSVIVGVRDVSGAQLTAGFTFTLSWSN